MNKNCECECGLKTCKDGYDLDYDACTCVCNKQCNSSDRLVLDTKTCTCNCRPGLIYDSVTEDCYCPGLQVWDPTAQSCVCPKGFIYSATYKNCTCPRGQYYDIYTHFCECPGDQFYDPYSEECFCPIKGQTFNEDLQYCECPACPSNYTASVENDTCVCKCSIACKRPALPDFDACECYCPKGFDETDYGCLCPGETYYNNSTDSCVCEGNQIVDPYTNECFCPIKGQEFDPKSQTCICPGDKVVNETGKLCMCDPYSCPDGLVVKEIGDTCKCECPLSDCRDGATLDEDLCECVCPECPPHHTPSAGEGCGCECTRSCDAGYTLDKDSCTCRVSAPAITICPGKCAANSRNFFRIWKCPRFLTHQQCSAPNDGFYCRWKCCSPSCVHHRWFPHHAQFCAGLKTENSCYQYRHKCNWKDC